MDPEEVYNDASRVAVPPAVRALVGDAPVVPVWKNELGGLTFRVGDGADRYFVKWTPVTSGIDLRREVRRLRWAAAYRPVPRVLDVGGDEDGCWIRTAGLPGETAVSLRWRADPARGVPALGAGLRAFHDALPIATCPFSWSVADRLADITNRAAGGLIDRAGWHPEHRHLSIPQALDRLAAIPSIDTLVVCQGDACSPNTLLTDGGHCSGHVDLGQLGTADRWADLAIATWSTQWNYGPGWEIPLLDAYGVAPDPDRTSYYRLLWDLGP